MSASQRFLFRGFKILTFSLKVLIKIGSFMWVSTVAFSTVASWPGGQGGPWPPCKNCVRNFGDFPLLTENQNF